MTRLVFFGTPDFVIPVLIKLNTEFELIGIVTTDGETPVGQFAKTNLPNISVFAPQQFNNVAIEQLRALRADLFVVAAYGKILPQEILDIPKFGALNIHPSLLPKYRGATPVQSAILHGDKTTGITIIKMDSQMDHGPIVFQEKVELKGDETSKSLLKCVFEKAADSLPNVINEYIKGSIQLVAQNDDDATYCQQITKQDGFFDIDKPPSAEKLDRMIRAYYPWPSVWTKLKMEDGRWKILKFLPGKKLQVEGKKPQSLKDFLNGYPQLREEITQLFQ